MITAEARRRFEKGIRDDRGATRAFILALSAEEVVVLAGLLDEAAKALDEAAIEETFGELAVLVEGIDGRVQVLRSKVIERAKKKEVGR